MEFSTLVAGLPVWGQWLAAVIAMLGGMWVLTKSADLFVEGSVALATRLRMPALLVGFIIVGFGTSAPEMLVSVLAAAQGSTPLSLGNAYGSNITNVLLILGASMLVAPIVLHRVALRRDIPFLLFVIVLFFCLGLNGFSRMDGIILVSIFLAFLFWQVGIVLFQRGTVTSDDAKEQEENLNKPMGIVLLQTFGGLSLLLLSSQVLVCAACFMANNAAAAAGITPAAAELIVGVTIVALGTSLPELMASISAMRHGQPDIALGNVVGSNCFNICIVAGLALIIRPVDASSVPSALMVRDPLMMLGTTLLLAFCGWGTWALLNRRGKRGEAITLTRWWGVLYLVLWVAYTLIAVCFTRG
jgi:cation:H+ antiporter